MTTAPAFNAEGFKAATRDQWDEAASGWSDHSPQIRDWLRLGTQAMIDMAGVKANFRVLDVAAGAGDQTLDIAERVGPGGSVLATDISSEILKFAKLNAEAAGYRNVETLVADGETLALEKESFDAAVSRLGLMFLPDPLGGLKGIYSALKPGAGICTMVFSAPQANPCIVTLMSTACKHAGIEPRDPFQPGGLLSLGKPGLIDTLFREAGFCEVATTKISAPFKLPTARDYLSFIRTSASPIQQILSKLDASKKDAAWDDMENQLLKFATAAGWEGPNELLLTAGKR